MSTITNPRKCVICGCSESLFIPKPRFLTNFPLDERRCMLWIKYVGIEDLAYIPIEKLHVLKQVCSHHFLPQDFNEDKKSLKESAIPLIELNRKPLMDDVFSEFPFHINSGPQSKHADAGIALKIENLAVESNIYNDHNIHQDLVKVWSNTLCQGLPTRLKTDIMNKYSIPNNCELLSAPSFNPRISAVLPMSTRARDETMKRNQGQLGLGISAVAKILSALLNGRSKDNIIEKRLLNDACNILTDLHFRMSQHRLSMLTGDESFSIIEEGKNSK